LRRPRDIDRELAVAGVFLVLGAVGWWLHSPPLAIVGILGGVTTITLFVWQRDCLKGVAYSRKLGQGRATFGEEVALEVEILNDKLLPLAWLEIADDVPKALDIEGGTVVPGSKWGAVDTLVNLRPMLPYQRIRRRLKVICCKRGVHTFGPAVITSGDPIGLRTRYGRERTREQLLVYPKIFALAPEGVASRVLIGDDRSRFQLIDDPSRVAGIREYRPGDPLRNIDWRATARSTTLLVREFEPTVTLRVAVFVDFRVPHLDAWPLDSPELEFTIAVAASFLSAFARLDVPVGLFSSGAVEGNPLAYPPSSSPAALPTMLEALARASAFGPVRFSTVLGAQSGRLNRGTSAVVVAADFPEPVLVALAELRRSYAVTAVWVASERGAPPPRGAVDASLTVGYADDWARREILELAL
jgi:hypothetical protein